MTLIGAASLAAALLTGCGDNDAKPVSSKAGQSCVRTADCADGLSCIANVCYSSSSAGGSGGSGGSAVVGPVLGGDGESCTSRRDCMEGLACFNQRCTKSDSVGAGGDNGGSPVAQLGARGETCRINADCDKGLSCIPSNTVAGVGVCDVTNFGITPTGMYCGGECEKPADCCQLPSASGVAAELYASCSELDNAIKMGSVDCATAQVAGTTAAHLCFLDATYCSGCTTNTWKCTDNQCEYNLACTATSLPGSPKGCPNYTRLGHTVPGCNTKTLKCTGAGAAACTDDASCVGQTMVDRGEVCVTGECTCHTDHNCYRACARDLDCATGKVCDKKSSLCVPDTVCTTDAQCATRSGSIDYKCQTKTNTCYQSCSVDTDCSGTGHIVGGVTTSLFRNSVCVDGACTSIANDCVDNSQCGLTNGYKTFCITRPDVAAASGVSSAITN
jgi:hypothetical protein